jgi:glutathione S-transferase
MPHQLWTSTNTSGTLAHLVAAQSGLDIQPRFISLRNGDHKQAGYLAINPRSEVPALQLEDGTVITELPAIMTWMADMAPASGLLPAAHPARAKALSWLAWCHFRMARDFSMAFQATRMADGDEALAPVLRAAAIKRATAALQHADGQITADHTLLGGPANTIADMFVAQLMRFGAFLRISSRDMPRLRALSEHVFSAPRIAAALELEAAQN